MPTQDDVQRLALAQLEASEQPHFERTSFRVRGKIFATFQPSSGAANLALPPAYAVEMLEREPDALSPIVWGSIKGWMQVDLARASPALLEALVPTAWSRVAPKTLKDRGGV